MAAPMVKTRTPGIYKRGERYLFTYRDTDGKQRWESCRTLDEARRAKAARSTDVGRGEFEASSRITLHDYAREWVERYQGRGRRGFRDHTRKEYRRQLDQYAFRYFPAGCKLTEVTPSKVAGFVAWLCDPAQQDGRALGDSTIRNITKPLRACLASAVREGLIRSNPARDADMPHRPTAEDAEDDEVRALSRDELATLLETFPDRWRLFFELLAATGLRISEAVALQWRHLELDGPTHVKLRRALVKGQMGPLKSRYARRDVPLDHALVLALRDHHKATEWPGDEDPVFPAEGGGYLDAENLRRRVLKPTRGEACLEWVGFHTFRHTCATMLFAEGRNAVQVQRWLGHHSAAFTLATYVHLLDGDMGTPLTIARSVNKSVNTPHTTSHRSIIAVDA